MSGILIITIIKLIFLLNPTNFQITTAIPKPDFWSKLRDTLLGNAGDSIGRIENAAIKKGEAALIDEIRKW